VANYDGSLRKYALKTIGEKKIADIAADDVRVLLNAIRDTKGKLRRNPHDFRHLCKTWLAERLVPREVRDEITHHGVSRVESTYNSAKLQKPVLDALNRWIAHVEAVARLAGADRVPNNVSPMPHRDASSSATV
jgi:integrase